MPTSTVLDTADLYRWAQRVTLFDGAGLLIEETVTFDDGRLRMTAFEDGVRTTRSWADPLDTNEWMSISETFSSVTGLRISQTRDMDDERVFVSVYDDGVITSRSGIDDGDAFEWGSFQETYDSLGRIASKVVTFDDGRTSTTNYIDGVRTERTVSDFADAYLWSTKAYDYDDATGQLLTVTTLFDDGSSKVMAPAAGALGQTITRLDGADAYDWASRVRTYDAKGDLLELVLTLDDGTAKITTFTAGLRVQTDWADELDVHDWESSTLTYDAGGQVATKSVTFDDGRQLVKILQDGVRTMQTVTDTSDAYVWASRTKSYDSAAQIESSVTTYDDGTIVTNGYVDGVRQEQLVTDPLDAHDWDTIYHLRDTDTGALLHTHTTLDDGTQSYVDVRGLDIVTGGITATVVEDSATTLQTGGLITLVDGYRGATEFTPAASVAGDNGYGTFTLLANGTWSYSAGNSLAAIEALNTGDTLTDSFTAVTTDGVEATVRTTIEGVNDAPIGIDATFNLRQGGSVTGSFVATDVDGGTLSFSVGSSGLLGALTVDTNGTFTYVAGTGQTSDETVTINVVDGNGGTTTLEATFDLNLPPVFAGADGVLVALTQESDTLATNAIDVSKFFSDPDGTALTFSAQLVGSAALPGTLTIDSASGVISGAPSGDNDLYRIEVTATDAIGLSVTGEFWLAAVDEILLGDANGSSLVEGDFSSFVDGLGGNDSLFGGDQVDIYQYSLGDGFDIIEENGFGDSDRLVFNGFASTDVTFERLVPNSFGENGGDLLIRPSSGLSGHSQGVLVRDGLHYDASSKQISDFSFDDGVTLTQAEVRAMILVSEITDGADDIHGFASDDTLEGGRGNDLLVGGDGSDVYLFNAGDGADTIRDTGFMDADVLTLGFNQADASFSMSEDGADLFIDFGSGDHVSVVNGLTGNNADTIEIFQFFDAALTIVDVRNIIVAQQKTSGNDLIIGFDGGSETLEGGAGNDTLVGRDGIDTYIYRAGDGIDRIEERGFRDNDILQIFDFTIDYDFATGQVQAGSQVSFSRGGQENAFFNNNLIINLDNGAGVTGQIFVFDTLTGSTEESIATIEFVDSGVSLNMANIRSDIVSQQETDSDDIVTGFNAADTLFGGLGDDTLIGEDGADIYVFSTGDGNDFVSDRGFQDADRVVFTDRALADFTITYAPGDDQSIILTAGGDSIEIEGALAGGNVSNVHFFDFTDQTVSELEMRQIVVDQALTQGLDLIGADGAQIMPSSIGSDRFVSGRDGSDTYTFVSGDGNDTIFDDGNDPPFDDGFGDTDVLDLTTYTSAFFTSAGSGQLLLDPAYDNNVVLRAGSDRLSLIDLSDFEQVLFSDVTFDNNTDDLDGATNFADFVTANGIQTKVLVQGTTASETFLAPTDPFAPPVDEHFDLGGGDNDQVLFNVSQIGNDSIFQTVQTTGGYDITIDFTGIIADSILEQSVSFAISRLDPNDLIITIIHRDTSTIDPVAGIGETLETITINDALAQFSGVDSISIVRENGTEIIATTQELRQIILDQQVTSGDDLIFGYSANDTVTGGAGDDTINAGRLSDRYDFFAGDEGLFVADGIATTPIDVIAIHGYSIDDASLSRSAFNSLDLIIDFGTDEITVSNFFRNPTEIEQFQFEADTATPDIYNVAQLTVEYFEDIRTSGGDFLLGSDRSNDTLDGGAGDDTLGGGRGDDLYIVRMGEGNDFVRDSGGGTDTIQLDVASNDVTFTQNRLDPNDFHINMADGTNIRVQNFLGNNNGVIEQFQFTDGTLDAEQARMRAFGDLATTGNDRIIGGDDPDTLRGGPGDDYVSGGGDVDVFEYTLGDGDDRLAADGSANSFELIRVSGVSLADLLFQTVQGTRDEASSTPSLGQDLLISFVGASGSIRVDNGLAVSNPDVFIEVVDAGVTLTKSDIISLALVGDLAAGDTTLAGPSSGGTIFPSGADFIFSQAGADTFQFNIGDGNLVIVEDAPDEDINRLIITGYDSTEATLQRLASGSEDYLVLLPNGEQILALGESNSGALINGVNEIYFADDGVTWNDADISSQLG